MCDDKLSDRHYSNDKVAYIYILGVSKYSKHFSMSAVSARSYAIGNPLFGTTMINLLVTLCISLLLRECQEGVYRVGPCLQSGCECNRWQRTDSPGLRRSDGQHLRCRPIARIKRNKHRGKRKYVVRTLKTIQFPSGRPKGGQSVTHSATPCMQKWPQARRENAPDQSERHSQERQ